MTPTLRVLLMQLPVPNNPGLNTPLAAGYLKAYAAAQGLLDALDIELLPRAIADYAGDALLVEQIAARHPDVLGISLYTWNSERSLAIAARAKTRLPKLRVVVGGPEVQRDNAWVLAHPAVDVAVIGEGEQTFAELLRLWSDEPRAPHVAMAGADRLAYIPGVAYRDGAKLRFAAERVPLSDLAALPSPYLAGYLDVPPDGMLMVEVSRWCPYSCSFCLYGRNMGAKLGNRYFGLERVLAEIAWGRERGIARVHFVEANLNLVPLFWPLMRALEDLNADRRMTFYAELRGEHLTEEVVAALDRANVRYVEVGLQTANPAALKASLRRTDLHKWAAGTRRLYAHGIEVYLDVILGLPADDQAGVAATLDFIEREHLGPYDVFTLQVLPGTAVRRQAGEYGLRFQDRPPYYVLATDRLDFAALRRLRRDLKQGAGLAPDAVEGLPEPRASPLIPRRAAPDQPALIEQLWLVRRTPTRYFDPPSSRSSRRPEDMDMQAIFVPFVSFVDQESRTCNSFASFVDQEGWAERLALHVDLVLRAEDLQAATPTLASAIMRNPATLFDVYLLCGDDAPNPEALRRWRAALPYQPGYLERVAVYRALDPAIPHRRVSPRCFVVLPWTATVDPAEYGDSAEVIWRFTLAPGEPPPYRAWRAAGGAGIWLHGAEDAPDDRAALLAGLRAWEHETGRRVWLSEWLDEQISREMNVVQ